MKKPFILWISLLVLSLFLLQDAGYSTISFSVDREHHRVEFHLDGHPVAELNGPAPAFLYLQQGGALEEIRDLRFFGRQTNERVHFRSRLPGGLEFRQTLTRTHSGDNPVIRSSVRMHAENDVSFVLMQPYHFESNQEPVYFSPGHLYRTNNAAISNGKFPQLVPGGPVGIPESSVFTYRADRSSHSAILSLFDEKIFGLCLPEGFRLEDEYYYNGLGVDASDQHNGILKITFGYRNYPARYNGNCSPRIANRWEDQPDVGWVSLRKGQTVQMDYLIYLDRAESVFAWEKAQRVFYDFLAEELTPRTTPDHAARLITKALVEDAVVEECGLFRVTDQTDECDIGWTGGMMVAYPLFLAAEKLDDPKARKVALNAMDQLVNQGFNADSGFFFDAWRNGQWTVDGWWQMWAGGYHLAYTNGQSVYYLLEAYDRLSLKEQQERRLWLARCRSVVDQAVRHQKPSGEFPASYSPEDGTPGRIVGFGGCWMLPAALSAYRYSGDTKYLEAAKRAESFYFDWMSTLEVWGTPIDAEGAVELEGNLPLILAQRMLYDLTKDRRYLTRLEHAVHYDFTWKWAYNTHLANPPLRDMNWKSQGGNGASTCNIHLHPMSNLILDQVWFLYKKTGDPYYSRRYRDSLVFGLGCVNLVDGDFGFGKAGWGSEQFFHTDAIQGQGPSDGGIWTRYLPWSMSSVLYGIVTAPDEYYEGLKP